MPIMTGGQAIVESLKDVKIKDPKYIIKAIIEIGLNTVL